MKPGVYADDAALPAGAGSWTQVLPASPPLSLSTFAPSLAEDILTCGFWYCAAGICWRIGVVFMLVSNSIYALNHIYRLRNGPLE